MPQIKRISDETQGAGRQPQSPPTHRESIGLRKLSQSPTAFKTLALVAASALAVGGFSLPAQAASTDRAESEGLMLSGGGLIILTPLQSSKARTATA